MECIPYNYVYTHLFISTVRNVEYVEAACIININLATLPSINQAIFPGEMLGICDIHIIGHVNQRRCHRLYYYNISILSLFSKYILSIQNLLMEANFVSFATLNNCK